MVFLSKSVLNLVECLKEIANGEYGITASFIGSIFTVSSYHISNNKPICTAISQVIFFMILHETYDYWTVAVLTVTEHFIYSHFLFFFKLVAFCTEFNLFTPTGFVLFMIMDLPYICSHAFQ